MKKREKPQGRIRRSANGRRPKEITLSPPVELSDQEKIEALAQALSDPADTRTTQELAEALEIPVGQILSLRSKKSFMEPIAIRLRENLQGPILVDVIKILMGQSQRGVTSASRLVLEVAKEISSGTNVMIGGALSAPDRISTMSDEELDYRLHKLIPEVFPPDITFSRGEVIPIGEVTEVTDM